MGAVFGQSAVLCGHRGMGAGTVCGHAENTLGSFRAAAEAGLPWVEADVRLTADGVLVCRHDATLADGRFVAEAQAAETGLLTFDELLAGLPPHVGIDVEIKSALEDALRPRGRTTAARVAERLADERRPLLVSSFDASVLAIVRERAELPLGLLTWMRFPLRKGVPAAVHLGAQVLLPHASSFGVGPGAAVVERPPARHVEVAHAAGLEVAVWGLGPAEADALLEAGADCLIVDHDGADTWRERI